MEIKVECSKCGQHVILDDSLSRQIFTCPECGQNLEVVMPPPIQTQPVPPTRLVPTEIQNHPKQGAAIGGWVCFGLATVFMFIPIPTWFIYGPLFLASFILSIIAISQKRIASGIMLLLATIVGAPVLFFIAIAVGIGTWMGALDGLRHNKADTLNILTTNTISPSTSTTNPSTPTSDANSSTPSFNVRTEKIEGAFGMKLGDAFDPNSNGSDSKLTDGTPMYEFPYSTGFRSFKSFYVLITPTTHKIYSIWAIANVENTQAGQKEQAVIMEILKQKYGIEDNQGILDTIGDVKRLEQGRRYIITKLNGFTDVTLDIRYYDGDLEKLAETERLSEETKKTDHAPL